MRTVPSSRRRGSKAAPSGPDERDHIAAPEVDIALAGQLLLRAVRPDDARARGRAHAGAFSPRGREPRIALLHVVHPLGVVSQQLVVAPQAHPAGLGSGAARAVDQLGPDHAPRVLQLGDLRGQQRAVGRVGVDRVVAGRVAARAAAPAEDVREQRHPAGAWVDGLEHERREGDLAGRDRAVGQEVAERADHQIGEALDREVAGAERGRERRVEQAARPRAQADPAREPGVLREADEAAHREEHARVGAGQRDVDAGGDLVVGGREVDVQLAVAGGHRGPDPDGRGPLEPAVVEEALDLDRPLRPGRERRGGPLGRALQQPGHGAGHGVRAVAGAQRAQALHAPPAGGELGVEVSERGIGVAHVGGDEVVQLAVALAAADELERREDQPFLEQLGALGALGARHAPADVDVMGDRAGVADQLALVVRGREHLQVRRVRAPQVRVVGEDGVAGLQRAVAVQRRLERELHEAELGGDLLGVRDHRPLAVEDAAVEVEHLADDRRERRAVLDDRHLLGDAPERVGEDLVGDGIGHRASTTMSAGPTSPRQPAGTTTVASSCSTSVRSAMRSPGRSAWRSSTA